MMDHLAVSGFPNWRGGDSGVVMPGIVVGFRTVTGVRRILTNAGIVAGMSGGPVLAAGNVVIGIAVTGADSMATVQETENHGIIPIDALKLLGL
jgi:S1-C subfamily serine protease